MFLRPSDRPEAPDGVPEALWTAVQQADRVLYERCGDRLIGDEEEDEQARFEELCHSRWGQLANSDDALVAARERLYEADRPMFRAKFQKGLEERHRALAGPLAILRNAGEEGVPHLALAMTTDTWASILAVELLAELPAGPLRDKALVESVFLPGDWAPEAGERAAGTIPLERRWSLFEAEAREAHRAGIELQSLYWTSLFEEGPGDETDRRPTRDLERATALLYDLGHHSALVAGLGFLLDLAVSGPERVHRNLKDGNLERVLATIAQRPPALRPNRPPISG
ncbi:MAG: hypothetical protein ACREBZ_03770 [Thermoplasmata archaeon]